MASTETISALSEIHRFTGEILAGETGGIATNLLEKTQGACAKALRTGEKGGPHEVLGYGRGALQRLSTAAPGLAAEFRCTLRALQEAL